jgi:hypothetical protein
LIKLRWLEQADVLQAVQKFAARWAWDALKLARLSSFGTLIHDAICAAWSVRTSCRGRHKGRLRQARRLILTVVLELMSANWRSREDHNGLGRRRILVSECPKVGHRGNPSPFGVLA